MIDIDWDKIAANDADGLFGATTAPSNQLSTRDSTLAECIRVMTEFNRLHPPSTRLARIEAAKDVVDVLRAKFAAADGNSPLAGFPMSVASVPVHTLEDACDGFWKEVFADGSENWNLGTYRIAMPPRELFADPPLVAKVNA